MYFCWHFRQLLPPTKSESGCPCDFFEVLPPVLSPRILPVLLPSTSAGLILLEVRHRKSKSTIEVTSKEASLPLELTPVKDA